MYVGGRGVPKDEAKAFELYQKTAEEGDSDAQFLLGLMFSRAGVFRGTMFAPMLGLALPLLWETTTQGRRSPSSKPKCLRRDEGKLKTSLLRYSRG